MTDSSTLPLWRYLDRLASCGCFPPVYAVGAMLALALLRAVLTCVALLSMLPVLNCLSRYNGMQAKISPHFMFLPDFFSVVYYGRHQ